MPETQQVTQPNGGNPPPNIVERAPAPQLPNGNGGDPAATAVVVPDWAKDFDDGSKALIAKKQWKERGDMARAYSELEKFAYRDGADKVLIPDATTPEKDRDEFYKKLGWPEKPDDYQFKAPEEAQEYSGELADWFRTTAHKHHIPDALAETLHVEFVSNYLDGAKTRAANDATQHAEWDRTLHREFGNAYDQRVEIARRAVRTFGDAELIKVLNDSGLGDHPSVVRAFAKMGMKLGEQNLMVGDEQHGSGMTPTEAQDKISAIRRDAKHAFNNPGAPDHAHAVAQMRTLYESAYPGEANRQDVRR